MEGCGYLRGVRGWGEAEDGVRDRCVLPLLDIEMGIGNRRKLLDQRLPVSS
jgi:hypothetical protein